MLYFASLWNPVFIPYTPFSPIKWFLFLIDILSLWIFVVFIPAISIYFLYFNASIDNLYIPLAVPSSIGCFVTLVGKPAGV